MTISVLGMQPKYFIRPNNTDWRHNHFLEKAIATKDLNEGNSVKLLLRSSTKACLAMSARYIRRTLSRDLPFLRQNKIDHYLVPIYKSDTVDKFDSIYSYGCYPNNSPKPVVWHTGPTNIELLLRRNINQKLINEELDCKERCAELATIIAVSSDRAEHDFKSQFPRFSKKVVVLPFVLPLITTESEVSIHAKHQKTPVNILFVGREAKRKGLDFVIHAFNKLRANSDVPIMLTIVSNLSDGFMDIPSLPNLRWFKSLGHDMVQVLMKDAHILAMPSREESFGLVYLEAMAAGAVCIAPAREPQISILGHGRFGSLCEVTIDSVYHALESLVENNNQRSEMAIEGVREFDKVYSIRSVLPRYKNAFVKSIT